MLTVTICAPLAAIASRITPKSLYFPVPTISRESKLFPPMTSLSVFISPSLRHRHHFDDVAIIQLGVGNAPGAIDLFSVHHDNHALINLHLVEQAMERETRPVRVATSVDGHATPTPA